MCKSCNYVQLQKDNVGKHLRSEHSAYNEDEMVITFEILNFKDSIVEADEEACAEDIEAGDNCDSGDEMPNLAAEIDEKALQVAPTATSMIDHTYFSPKTKTEAGEKEVVVGTMIPKKLKSGSDQVLATKKLLYAFYKCMYKECQYSTNDPKFADVHYKSHHQLIDNMECPYCDKQMKAQDLVSHLKTLHESCIYQCCYCFYRSCAAFNVVLHQKYYHAMKHQCILTCEGKQAQVTNEMEQIKQNRSRFVPPLLCTGKQRLRSMPLFCFSL